MVQLASPRRLVYAARNRLEIRGMPEKEQTTPAPDHALYVLGILIDAIARSSRPSEITGHVLEVAERAEVDGDHTHAAALRGVAEQIFVAQPVRVEPWDTPLYPEAAHG